MSRENYPRNNTTKTDESNEVITINLVVILVIIRKKIKIYVNSNNVLKRIFIIVS